MSEKNIMRHFVLTCGLGLLLNSSAVWGRWQKIEYPLSCQTEVGYKQLVKKFVTIPNEYKLRCYWLWLEGLATKESITQDLEQMKAKGFGGALIGDNGGRGMPLGPEFLSPLWLENFAHAVREADRLGLELSVNIQSGFGDPGNPEIQPDNGMKKIVFSEIRIKGPATLHEKLPIPNSQIYYEDICIQAFKTPLQDQTITNWGEKTLNKGSLDLNHYVDPTPDAADSKGIEPDTIINLMDHFAEGYLSWDVPAGDWTIVRYGMTATGKRNNYASHGYRGGLCYDQIHSRGISAHWDSVAVPLLRVAKNAGKSLKFVHTDSWEMGTTNWTHDFLETFKKQRGYDMFSYLPVFAQKIVGSQELSNRFLEDFRRTVGDLVADENYALLCQLAHDNGVFLHSESGSPHVPPIDALQTLGRNDIPMGEFWAKANTHRVTEARRMHVKQGSCAAHIYGKRFFAAEGPTTVGPQWERSPRDLKGVIDSAFINGVNRIFWHTYDSSPDEYGVPGVAYFAGTHLNRKVTWWNQADAFLRYVNRCQVMLSQGLYTADILAYYGNNVPSYVFLDTDITVPRGYAWDMCNSEVLLDRASIRNGRIYLPDGMNYRILYLPETLSNEAMALPVLRKIEQMVSSGMILVGSAPKRAFGLEGYPDSDTQVQAIVRKLWGNIDKKNVFMNAYGKGRVYAGKTLESVLKAENIAPDFSYTAGDTVDLEYIHRACDKMEIYYVTNKWARHGINDDRYLYLTDLPDRYIQAVASFRVSGNREIYRFDPITGQITPVSVFQRIGDRYILPVSLTPEGSAFFVFRDGAMRKHVTGIEIESTVLLEGNTPLVSGASSVFIGDDQIEIAENGNYLLRWSDDSESKISVADVPNQQTFDGCWKIRFTPPDSLGDPIEMEVDSLKSWTDFEQREIETVA